MKASVHLAIDLGASNGRVLAGVLAGRTLKLEEVHRFGNGGHRIGDHFYWDLVGLFSEIKNGLALAAKQYGRRIASVGVDTWGVDYSLVDRKGHLMGLPHQYRDPRTDGMEARACKRVPRRKIYEKTGIQFMFFNTMLQLMADAADRPDMLASAHRLLFTPDLINFWLTGRMTNEYTIASTSQLLNARTRGWAHDLIGALGLPKKIFGPLIRPGAEIGPVRASVCEETGLGPVRVIAPGCHDTASAVAAISAGAGDRMYLSSGTWSLMGVESAEPVINDASYRYGFTNEGGIDGRIRVLKNICGLWLVQECRRIWASQGMNYSYPDLRAEATKAEPFTALINPDDPSFATPGDMPARIAAFCRKTRQRVPKAPGEFVRVINESLALRYRQVCAQLEEVTGRRFTSLHVMGGGSREELLNQYTADALQRPVQCGPIEATALGNILVQMRATRAIPSLEAGHALIQRSFPLEHFKPREAAPWNAAALRFDALTKAKA